MARSRKKNLVITDRSSQTYIDKKNANKAVRNYPDGFFEHNPQSMAFKKCFYSWEICAY